MPVTASIATGPAHPNSFTNIQKKKVQTLPDLCILKNIISTCHHKNANVLVLKRQPAVQITPTRQPTNTLMSSKSILNKVVVCFFFFALTSLKVSGLWNTNPWLLSQLPKTACPPELSSATCPQHHPLTVYHPTCILLFGGF